MPRKFNLKRTILSGASTAALISIGLIGISNTAYASCTLNVATVSCSGTDTAPISTTFAGNVAVTLTDWTLSGGGFYSTVPNSFSNAVIATGTSISNDQTTNPVAINVVSETGNVSVSTSGGALTTIGNSGYGISAITGGAGTVTVMNGSAITTSGEDGAGINTSAVDGAITVNNEGVISTAGGTISPGIRAVSSGAGTIFVTNSGSISTSGNSAAFGIRVATSGSGQITVANSGSIATHGTGANGIFISSTGSSDATVSNTGNITVDTTAPGIEVRLASGNATINQQTGNVSVNGNAVFAAIFGQSSGNVILNMSGGTVQNNSTSASGHGIEARVVGAGTGVATVNFTAGSITSVGGVALLSQSQGTGTGNVTAVTAAGTTINAITRHGILARSSSELASTQVLVDSQSVITAGGDGILAMGLASATVTVRQTGGRITSVGNGINASTGGAISISNSADITTTGTGASLGIVASILSGSGSVAISNSGAIATTGTGANGIGSNTDTGALSIVNSGAIAVQGATAQGIQAVTVSGMINIDNSAMVIAQQGDGVLAAASSGIATVNLTNRSSGSLFGMTGVEIRNGFSTAQIDNAGFIGASTDRAILSSALETGPLTINNTGTVTGYMLLGTGLNTLNNAGAWNLRNFADTDGNGTPDKLSVAVSDFGTSGTNTINNSGTLALLGHGADTVTTLDTSGMYLPLGFTFNTMAATSPVQGQILGVQTFNNSGVIDLTANASAGDVLVISGGHTAGTDGGGVFVANGGTLKLNTVLNEGGVNSQSDILVVDSTRLGSAPTRITISPVGVSVAGLTVDNGIALVEVLNKSASADGVFALGSRVASGAYEYNLFHGGVGADSADGNWYLRNTVTNPNDPNGPAVPNIRPEVPVDMVILPLAIEYGYAMLDTLHERVGETYLHLSDPATEERVVWCKDPATNFKCKVRVPVASANGAGKDETKWARSGWARLIGDRGFHDSNNFTRRGPDYNYTFGGIQAGLDVYAREQADGTLDKAGIYVGYGQITSDVKGLFGGKAGSVDMDAYTIGGYWTHHSSQGWYTDAVVQGTWYAADAKSIYNQQIKPDGFGILGSLEGGYSFKLGNNWTLEPQAQIVYQNVSFDNARDQFGLVRFDDGDSLRGRLGLRLTKTWNRADEGREPRLITGWLRANVWHEFLGKSTTRFGSLDGQNMSPFNTYLAGTWGEIGAGVTAQVSDKINLFASGAYNRSLDNKGREGWDGRLGMTVKW